MSNELTNRQEILTDHGLNLPENMSEEQFFKIGRTLGNIEKGLQWAVGDWYNSISSCDKQAACERVGLNYSTARSYGSTAAFFQIDDRKALSFTHYQTLTVADLRVDQRIGLIAEAEALGWTVRTLKMERDKLLGTWVEPVAVDSSDAIASFVQQKLPNLPPKHAKQVERAVKAAAQKLAGDFEEQVSKAVTERMKEQRKRLAVLEADAKKEFDNAIELKRGVKAFMTKREFQMVRSCLHPDKHHGSEQAKYSKAFEVFNRLLQTVDSKSFKSWTE